MVHKNNVASSMAMGDAMLDFLYGDWYAKDVSPNLTKPQKVALLHKISDCTLDHPVGVGIDVDRDAFPELRPFMHTEKLSSVQLTVVMKGLFREVMPKEAKRSGI